MNKTYPHGMALVDGGGGLALYVTQTIALHTPYDGDGLALYVKQTREWNHPFLMKLSIEDVFLIARKGNLPCFGEVRCMY